MGLKIIGGEFRGRNLLTLPDLNTRPTANRTREALFNILAFKVKNAVVLDLFAGSGALGLEALSRGAQHVTLVENNRKACEIIAKNIALCKAQNHAKVICCNAELFKGQGAEYDLVLMDPPYGQKLTDKALKVLTANSLLNNGAVVVAEHEAGEVPVYDNNVYTLSQTRVYGKAALSFFEYNNYIEA